MICNTMHQVIYPEIEVYIQHKNQQSIRSSAYSLFRLVKNLKFEVQTFSLFSLRKEEQPFIQSSDPGLIIKPSHHSSSHEHG